MFVQAAYENKITQGTNATQTKYGPWDPIRRATRGEVAHLLWNLMVR